ncbi:Fic family protein [Candidatus Cloacimonas acidaminovorans]|uniref:Fic family protein n=1 Tax=Cloacimonas acidaminovorans (strain Evry) TaxID=459349 RepID=B0VIJ4_CLOAI|nr:Fic family protein [Candidatus Cloacimonas acidaminovorans]OQC36145.1 MAG: Adenosine monophosphate-protein transferase SoFic [Bacteroidetes bacterium ADurb.Bin041]CAO81135.1 Fic family protein [Candidatus Cloacimonas acidaminovorans str. Evry]
MKFEEFKSGTYKNQFQYKSFLPSKINHQWTWDDPRINLLLEKAAQTLGELNAFSRIVPNVDLFIRMHILKEANTSSRIEGTKTDIEDVVLDESSVFPEKRDDWQEVQNYVQAMNEAIKQLENLPLSLRLIRNTHRILMTNVRGKHKTPGEFRTSQNWIGGSSLADAAFIPPHKDDMSDLLDDFEHFLYNDRIVVPHLIRCAIAHYQFETIHPFQDGNGRIGRLLITLYLVSNHLLIKPTLYLSDFFERHRGAYYDSLTRVRDSNDLGQWVRFFLEAVMETAEKGKTTFAQILNLHTNIESELMNLGKKTDNARKLLKHLYQSPVVSVKQVESILGVKYYSANELIKTLVEINILEETTGYSRNRVFMFKRYIDVFKE